jgi:hypothetical protein
MNFKEYSKAAVKRANGISRPETTHTKFLSRKYTQTDLIPAWPLWPQWVLGDNSRRVSRNVVRKIGGTPYYS